MTLSSDDYFTLKAQLGEANQELADMRVERENNVSEFAALRHIGLYSNYLSEECQKLTLTSKKEAMILATESLARSHEISYDDLLKNELNHRSKYEELFQKRNAISKVVTRNKKKFEPGVIDRSRPWQKGKGHGSSSPSGGRNALSQKRWRVGVIKSIKKKPARAPRP